MKNNVISIIIVAALFLTGLAILCYPLISNWYYQREADRKIEQYLEKTKSADYDTDELKKAYKYNKSLIGETPPDSFRERESVKYDKEYDGLLNAMDSGMMGIVEIPSINVNLPIYHYTTKEILEKGAGHLSGSSLPVGGKGTHAVITAHRGLPNAKMFTDLNQLKQGSIIRLHVYGKDMAYYVEGTKTVKPDDCSDLKIVEGRDMITLVTCTPYGKNTKRLLVRALRTKYPGKDAGKKQKVPWVHLLWGLAGVLAAVLVVFGVRTAKRKLTNRPSQTRR